MQIQYPSLLNIAKSLCIFLSNFLLLSEYLTAGACSRFYILTSCLSYSIQIWVSLEPNLCLAFKVGLVIRSNLDLTISIICGMKLYSKKSCEISTLLKKNYVKPGNTILGPNLDAPVTEVQFQFLTDQISELISVFQWAWSTHTKSSHWEDP